MSDPQNKQSIENMKGEVRFRQDLYKQLVEGEVVLPDYMKKEEHDKVLLERMENTKHEMQALKATGVAIGQYLEVGAERCIRALVMENDLGAEGIAADLSLEQLRSAAHFAKLFGKPKLPIRLCCDANNLPIRTGALNFAFVFEFLHHFPTPDPIIKEIRRSLGEGVFYFEEEPFKKLFQAKLYKQKHKIYSEEYKKRPKLLRFIEGFFSEHNTDEDEYNVIENEDITLKTWDRALSCFERRDLTLTSMKGKVKSKFKGSMSPMNFLNFMFGGEIGGVCRTHTQGAQSTKRINLHDALVCPNCLAEKQEVAFPEAERSVKAAGRLECPSCHAKYPVVDGVIVLMARKEFQALYPEHYIA